MQFYFIRHGQSTNNLLWRRTGSSKGRNEDPELTDLGRRQAEILAAYLQRGKSDGAGEGGDNQNVAGFGITHLYTSLMVRSVATGTEVSRALDLPLVVWQDMHEGGGIYLDDDESGERVGKPGRNRAYFETHYPELVLPQSLDNTGWWNRPYEDNVQRALRARRVLDGLLEKHGGTEDRVAVISHGGFYNDFLAALLTLPSRDGFWFALNNAAITRVDFLEGRTALVYTNRASYLPGDLVT
jgi:2,3-bisphosphoglycerate-dependent phosphoglycerate mutase